MKHLFLIALMLIGLCTASAAGRIVIVDDVDNEPVVGATVVSRSGLILGITDADGRIKGLKPSDFPLEIRSLGYEPMSVPEEVDTLALHVAVYPLSEVSVTPGDRPICRVVCYTREYSTVSANVGTEQMYGVNMTECYIADRELKGYDSSRAIPSVRKSRGSHGIIRFAGTDGTDSVIIRNVSYLPFLKIMDAQIFPEAEVREPQAIKNGAIKFTTKDKSGAEFLHRKLGSLYIRIKDPLSSKKNHMYSPIIAKMLGFTIDFKEMDIQHAFQANNVGKYDPGDLVFGKLNFNMLARGKWFKKMMNTKEPLDMNYYAEFYPVEVSYHTIDEYKEMIKNPSPIEFKEPDNLQPLPPAVLTLVERMEKEVK